MILFVKLLTLKSYKSFAISLQQMGYTFPPTLKPSIVNSFSCKFMMLSTRGQAYAEAGLADGYLGQRKAIFDKNTKHGIVSFSNAENVRNQFSRLNTLRIGDILIFTVLVLVSHARCNA